MTEAEQLEMIAARARAIAAQKARSAQAAEQPQAAPELDAARVGGLAARAGIEGVGVGATALPALVNDAVQQGANWI